jgi:transposase
MRSHGTAEELERRRFLAIRRIQEGRTLIDAARFLDVSYRSVKQWYADYLRGGCPALVSKPHPSRPSKLTAEQETEVLSWFDKSPADESFGFDTELWTAGRVADLIRSRFGIRYNFGYLLRWLRVRGITPQVVRRRPRGHDPAAMGAAGLAADSGQRRQGRGPDCDG